MGWRFRKSVSILPGVRINMGLHGTSLSVGRKGLRTTVSSTGRITRSIGIPGTGLSYVTTNNLGGSRRSHPDRGRSLPWNMAPTSSPSTLPQAAMIDTTEIRESILSIYRYADIKVDWRGILTGNSIPNLDNLPYFEARAERVLDGDIDTYFEILSDVNPFADLIEYGSGFECGTDDPRMLAVHFQVNSRTVLEGAETLPQEQFNLLLQDYVCGCTIRVARDTMALLPLRHVIVDASDAGKMILSVDFKKEDVEDIDFDGLDASDFVESLYCHMSFSQQHGFAEIEPIDQ